MSLDGASHGVPLPDVDPRLVRYLGLFPNLLVSLHPDYVLTHRLEPLAPDRTRVECEWLFPAEVTDPAYAVDFWDVTNRQDWAACESVQRGVSSPHFVPGPLAPNENAVYDWVTMVARAYRRPVDRPRRAHVDPSFRRRVFDRPGAGAGHGRPLQRRHDHLDRHDEVEPVDRARREPTAVGGDQLGRTRARRLGPFDHPGGAGERAQVGRGAGLLTAGARRADQRTRHAARDEQDADGEHPEGRAAAVAARRRAFRVGTCAQRWLSSARSPRCAELAAAAQCAADVVRGRPAARPRDQRADGGTFMTPRRARGRPPPSR